MSETKHTNNRLSAAGMTNGIAGSRPRFSRSWFGRRPPLPMTSILESYGQHNIGLRLGIRREAADHIQVNGPAGQRLGCMGHARHDHHLRRLGLGRCRLPQHRRGYHRQGRCHQRRLQRHGRRPGDDRRLHRRPRPDHDQVEPGLQAGRSCGCSVRWATPLPSSTAAASGVVCGVEPKNPDNVLGYRPCVGMVGGWIYFRGKTDDSYSRTNVKRSPPGRRAVAVADGAAARISQGDRPGRSC